MLRLPSAVALLGAAAAITGMGCSTYPYGTYPGGYPGGYPTNCAPGVSCTPGTGGGPGFNPPLGPNPYHKVWRDASGLHVQLATKQFAAWPWKGVDPIGVDIEGWIPRVQSEKIGWELAKGRPMVKSLASNRLDLPAPDGLGDGEKFNFSYESFGTGAWHRTQDSVPGVGINIVPNPDGSAAFIVQSNKSY